MGEGPGLPEAEAGDGAGLPEVPAGGGEDRDEPPVGAELHAARATRRIGRMQPAIRRESGRVPTSLARYQPARFGGPTGGPGRDGGRAAR